MPPGNDKTPGSSPKERDPLIGQLVAGRFKVEELIGQGGMGRVYRARHLALDRTIVLKMLKTALLQDPTVVGRFEREAKAASRLNHPNGIQVIDFGRDAGGGLFIAMEYVQGKDLRMILRDEWPLPEERLCNIVAQVLAALGEAHAHHVIHRDLKPENIMVEQRRGEDVVKVLDFGIAKILDSDLPGLTRSDVVCGTPQYMAPEQATGTALDQRCDLYAVGVILYQMATGHLPFDGQNSMEVLTRHVNEPPIAPRRRNPRARISPAMEAVILRALEKDPARRPQNAEEFRQLLLAVPKAAPAPAPPEQRTAPDHPVAPPPVQEAPLQRPRPPSRRKLVLGAMALAALLVTAVLSWRASHAGASQPSLSAAATGATAGDSAKAQELVLRASAIETDTDPAAARELLEQALRLDPGNAEAHYRLAGLFLTSQPRRARRVRGGAPARPEEVRRRGRHHPQRPLSHSGL